MEPLVDIAGGYADSAQRTLIAAAYEEKTGRAGRGRGTDGLAASRRAEAVAADVPSPRVAYHAIEQIPLDLDSGELLLICSLVDQACSGASRKKQPCSDVWLEAPAHLRHVERELLPETTGNLTTGGQSRLSEASRLSVGSLDPWKIVVV